MTTPTPVVSKTGKQARTVFFILAVLGVVLFLYVLSRNPDEHPFIPMDEDHRGITDWQECRVCHRADGSSPLPPQHPINMEKCTRCHQPEQAPAPPWEQEAPRQGD